MKRSVILIVIACLLVGAGSGYAAGYLIYEPKIRSYEILVSDLTSEVSSLTQTVSSQEAQISDIASEVSKLNQTVSSREAQILTLESEKSDLQTAKSALQSEISTLEQTISVKEAELSDYKLYTSTLEEEKSALQSEISNLETIKSALQSEISTIKSEMSSIQSTLDSAIEQIKEFEGQAAALQSQITNLKGRLQNILSVTVTQSYQWVYQFNSWKWELKIPLSLYVEYLERPRPQSVSYWVDMAKDSKDDSYIDQMIQQINSAAIAKQYNAVQKLNFVIAFVQSLPYTVDIETTPYDEYPRYPIETLFDRGGDCEDTSILVAALLDRMGYDVALLLLENAKHMAVGILITGVYGTYYEYDGKKYFYIETTGDGWQIGQIPPSITDTRATIYPLRN